MRKRNTLYKTAVLAASLALWGWAGMEVRGQADALITGNKWTNMVNTPIPAAVSLPAPGGTNGYNGAPAQRSQHVRTNGSGGIIFFEVDGKVYDGDGYLIADTRTPVGLFPACTQCLAPGVMEFVSVPVPGSCSLYYLLSAVPKTNNYNKTHVQFALLDMSRDNPLFAPGTGHYGKLIDLTDEIYSDSQYDQFDNWIWGTDYLLEDVGSPAVLSTSNYVAQLLTDAAGKSEAPLIRVVQGNTAGADPWMFVILQDRILEYRITNQGIYRTNPLSGSSYIRIDEVDLQIHQDLYRDADARTLPNGNIRLVMDSDWELELYPPDGFPPHVLLSVDLNPSTGLVVPQGGQTFRVYDLPSGCGSSHYGTGTAGLALRPDGAGVYVVGSWDQSCGQNPVPMFGHVDLSTGVFTNLTSNVPNVAQMTHSRFYRNVAPSGSGEAIYVPRDNGAVDAIMNLNTPVSVTTTSAALPNATAPLHVTPPADLTVDIEPRFLNTAVQGDQHLSAAHQLACCSEFSTAAGAVVGPYTQLSNTIGTWTPQSNPFQNNVSTFTFNTDVVVETNATLTITGMTLKFTENAKVIIERGGKLIGNGSTFTSLSCPGKRWPGIRVEGTTADHTQALPQQGNVNLYNCTVQNAVTGVWCARELTPNTADGNYYGGWVVANTSTFLNCITGVRIEFYQRLLGAATLDNLSSFTSCRFKTTNAWPDPGVNTPRYHAYLYNLPSLNGIQFLTCLFSNESPGQFPLLNRGWGILGSSAGFRAKGTNTPDACLFKGLTVGVMGTTGSLRRAVVQQCWFRDNLTGVSLLASTAPEVFKCTFYVPAMTSPAYPPTGITMQGSTAYTVEQNTFWGGTGFDQNYGILIKGNVYAENRIYNNTFHYMNVGTYTLNKQKGNTVATELLGLQLLCSDYYNCGLDYYLGNNTYIKHEQGNWSGILSTSQLAGNRFFTGVIDGITISTTQPGGAAAPFFNYNRHNVPECDPLNPSAYYADFAVGPTVFNKATACGRGYQPTIVGTGVSAYPLAAEQLKSAESYFTGTVDSGDRVEIRDAIKQDSPWLPSHTLRDYLLARCPLSDDVLLEVIYRNQPMDPWHLTQVMLANAKLSEQVMRAVEDSELLNQYMLAIVQNAGSGPSVKDLLEEEVSLRATEKAYSLVQTYTEIGGDSTLADPDSLLYSLIAAHADASDYYLLAGMALERGYHSTANAYLDSLVMAKDDEPALLRDLVSMSQTLGSDWDQADASQRALLAAMATSAEPGGAMAWAIRYRLGETDEIPTAEMPSTEKSLVLERSKATKAAVLSLLQAMPNPTTAMSMLVLGVELDEAALVRVSDPQGRVVRSLRLTAGQRIAELDMSNLANGLYTCELLQGDLKLEVTKLTVQR